MKRTLVLLAVAALALPVAAQAKGPSAASIDGPGTGGGISISGDGESSGTQLGNLAMQAGLPDALFQSVPNPMQASRPKGDLGPKYTITWTLPGPSGRTDYVKQDVYPYADPPVTYVKPGVKFFDDMEARGGWYVAGPALKDALVNAGLPKTAPATPTSDDSVFSTGLLSLFAAVLLLLAAAAFVLRRRTRPAPAA
jgi:MYXO-CTERM domain-containing protein